MAAVAIAAAIAAIIDAVAIRTAVIAVAIGIPAVLTPAIDDRPTVTGVTHRRAPRD